MLLDLETLARATYERLASFLRERDLGRLELKFLIRL